MLSICLELMRASVIAKLAWYKPHSDAVAGLYSCNTIPGITGEQAGNIMHYAECHKNLQFGWDFAVAMKNSDHPFPAILHGDDLYVWQAYMHLKGYTNSVISSVLALMTEGNANLRQQINALLLVDHIDCNIISTKLGVPVDMVRAYEKLFFNVLDRKEDHSFIASIAYPEGKLVEAMEDYIESASIGDLLMRAGYTHGASYVLYAAGLSKNPFSSLSAADGARKLDSMFMADGCLYAGLGWLHQRHNAMPIMNARLSMQAGKMGRGDEASETSMLSFGDSILSELEEVSKFKVSAQMRAQVLDVHPEKPSDTISLKQ